MEGRECKTLENCQRGRSRFGEKGEGQPLQAELSKMNNHLQNSACPCLVDAGTLSVNPRTRISGSLCGRIIVPFNHEKDIRSLPDKDNSEAPCFLGGCFPLEGDGWKGIAVMKGVNNYSSACGPFELNATNGPSSIRCPTKTELRRIRNSE